MATFGLWLTAALIGTAVFIPLLVIALVRLPSVRLAFVASASFSLGAMLGFIVTVPLAGWLHLGSAWGGAAMMLFVGAGTVGGAALALSLVRRFGSKKP